MLFMFPCHKTTRGTLQLFSNASLSPLKTRGLEKLNTSSFLRHAESPSSALGLPAVSLIGTGSGPAERACVCSGSPVIR